MKWLSTILGGPYGIFLKWGSIALVGISLWGVGFFQGSQHQKIVVQTKTITKTLKQIEYRDKVSAPLVAAQTKDNNKRHDEAVLSLEGVTPPSPPVCDWGPDTIGVLNSARQLPAQP